MFNPVNRYILIDLPVEKEETGSLIDSAINQRIMERVDNLSPDERETYGKQAEDLTDEQKEQIKKLLGQ